MSNAGERRLAAILAADVVGYSRMMGADEAATFTALQAHQSELIDPLVARHGGHIVKAMGDGFLIEFPSVVDAVRCSLEVQQGMAERNETVPEDRQIVFRMGINLGDIIHQGGDIFGDGVNVAARLETVAEPGGVAISQVVNDSIAGKIDVAFADSGEIKLKNIAKPLHVWSWPRRLAESLAGRKPLVTVGGFEGRSDSETELADALGEDIATGLSRLTGLEVTVDQEKADYLVRGAVRCLGQRCRISAQLIGLDQNTQIWADRYDEGADDPFAALDASAGRIVMSVRRQIAMDNASRLANQDLDHLSVEGLLTLAAGHFLTPTKQDRLMAGAIAERAVEKEPENFMALAMAAAGSGMAEIFFGYRAPAPDVVKTAFENIAHAQKLTNRSDMVLVAFSGLLLYCRGKHDGAKAAAERALQLNPGYSMGSWALGSAQVFAGDYQAGIDSVGRAIGIDIRDPFVHFYWRIAGYGYFALQQYAAAIDAFRKADQLAPDLPHNLAGLAASLWLGGDQAGARDVLERLTATEPDFRLRNMMVLPFRDSAVWDRLVEALKAAGALE